MFRRIFVPVDSPAALAAGRLAARLARAGDGRVRACYVVNRALLGSGTTVSLRDRVRDELATEGRRALRRVREICRRQGVPCSEALVEGDVLRELVKAARRFRADLMVVSTRGHGRLTALLLGSLVPALVRQAPCPLLLVRRRNARRARPARRRGAASPG